MGLKLLNIVLFWWWCLYCVVMLGIPSGVESRYLPTRRSSLSSDGEFERLQELLRNVRNFSSGQFYINNKMK